MEMITIDGEGLTIEDVVAVARSKPEGVRLRLSSEAQERVRRARQAVEDFVARGEVVYGVTTSFGALKDRLIPPDQAKALQRNMVMSHAVGVGQPLDEATVRAAMLIRANALAKGHSGVRLETLQALLAMVERGVHPVIPAKGSLGASGDLAPLAHMSLVLIGEGEAFYQGERLPSAEAMRRAGIEPIELEAKEGLALVNGTAVTAAIGALAVHRAERLSKVADIAGAMSLEALGGTSQAFDSRIQAVRPYPGQTACAAHIRRLIEGSQLLWRADGYLKVQDAYSVRCIPQIHGAVRDAIAYARQVVEIELNSATDNPLIFAGGEEAIALSGGNFHGGPLALAMDLLSAALAGLGNLSERRLARLLDGEANEGLLPAFLTRQGGLNTGFMLTQYTAAALVSENKVLAHPAGVDSIPASANVEDHVSMCTIAARHAREILENVETILAIELFAAAQAIDFRREAAVEHLWLGRGTAPAYESIREAVPFLERDAIMYPYIEAVRKLVATGKIIEKVEKAVGSTLH